MTASPSNTASHRATTAARHAAARHQPGSAATTVLRLNSRLWSGCHGKQADAAYDDLTHASRTDPKPRDAGRAFIHNVPYFRVYTLTRFVKALPDGEAKARWKLLASSRDHYPIMLSQSMTAARNWTEKQRRGTERAGLVASSSAQRLKPHAIDNRVNIDPLHWFLSPAKDTRSSLYLEDAATEFQVQALDLDWTIVTRDTDLHWSGDDWSTHSFRGAKWTAVKKPERRQYLKNAYRVLLTQARQGMVILVPPGAKRDKSRNPGLYKGG